MHIEQYVYRLLMLYTVSNASRLLEQHGLCLKPLLLLFTLLTETETETETDKKKTEIIRTHAVLFVTCAGLGLCTLITKSSMSRIPTHVPGQRFRHLVCEGMCTRPSLSNVSASSRPGLNSTLKIDICPSLRVLHGCIEWKRFSTQPAQAAYCTLGDCMVGMLGGKMPEP